MTLLGLGDAKHAREAHNLMQDVYDRRYKALGEGHLFTLWALHNLAKALTKRGILEKDSKFFDEAKIMFEEGIAVTTRNLGPNHLGTLMARQNLSAVFAAEGRYEEAETEFKDIAERQRHLPGSRNGTHRDRLATLDMLADCYEAQGRIQEAARVCEIIVAELDSIGGQQHPLRVKIFAKQVELDARCQTVSGSNEV